MKTNELNHYEVPEMKTFNVRLGTMILEGSTEGDLGCSDDDCRKDYA